MLCPPFTQEMKKSLGTHMNLKKVKCFKRQIQIRGRHGIAVIGMGNSIKKIAHSVYGRPPSLPLKSELSRTRRKKRENSVEFEGATRDSVVCLKTTWDRLI